MIRLGRSIVVLLVGLLGDGEARGEIDAAQFYRELSAAAVSSSTGFDIAQRTLHRQDLDLCFEAGRIFLLSAGGRNFAAVFMGVGSVRFTPPPGIERDQLHKFTRNRTLDERFERLLLYYSDPEIGRELVGDGQRLSGIDGEAEASRYHRERIRHLVGQRGTNLASAILRDAINRDSGFFAAEVDTAHFGVVSYRFDPQLQEPVLLEHWSSRFGGYLDVWCSYSPAAASGTSARLTHYDIDVHIRGFDIDQIRVVARLEPGSRPSQAIEIQLNPLMKLHEATDQAGTPLFVVREHLQNDEHGSPTFLLVLPEPLRARQQVRFKLSGKIVRDFHGGQFGIAATQGWYPRLGYYQRATYDLKFDVEQKYTVLASANKVGEERRNGRTVTHWVQNYPVASVAFNFGTMPITTVAIEGLPAVVVFGRETGFVAGDRVREVGIDVAHAMQFFDRRFGAYPFASMYATSIPYSHGQGFPGLLHLSQATFGGGVRGVDKAFRAHEVAHQWWGHLVGWKTYRDQWLSEGFAVYSGALFAADSLHDDQILGQMLDSWRNDILGIGNIGKSLGLTPFGQTREVMKGSKGTKAGPITLGERLASSLGRFDHQVLVYEKGAWVLHMLRMLMQDLETGSDDEFFAMLGHFVDQHRGTNVTTDDFKRVTEEHLQRKMDWFFDPWVYGTTVPRYRYGWRVEQRQDHPVLQLRIRQETDDSVPVRMPVLVRVDMKDGASLRRRVEVTTLDQIVEIPLVSEPRHVQFNDQNSVLCQASGTPF